MTEELFGEPRKHWRTSNIEDGMIYYLGKVGYQTQVTIQQLLDHLQENYPDVHPTLAKINFATVTWHAPATEEDRQKLIAKRKESDARNARWEQDMYLKLKKKYEGE